MSSMRGGPQHRLVNVNKPNQLRAWASYWGCTERNVRDAVRARGTTPNDVLDWIKVNVAR